MDLVIFETYEKYTEWLNGGEHPNKYIVMTNDGYCIFATNNLTTDGQYKTYTLHV